jgi:hypothetical protein
LIVRTHHRFPYVWENIFRSLIYYRDREAEDKVLYSIGAWLEDDVEKLRKEFPGYKFIAISTEVLSPNHWWSENYIIQKLSKYDKVWDLFPENCLKLEALGLNVEFTPQRFCMQNQRIPQQAHPEYDIDLLFIGSFTEYRASFYWKYISNTQVNFHWCFGMNERQMLDTMARSKIILNMPSRSDLLTESNPRINFALNNGKYVLNVVEDVNETPDIVAQSLRECYDTISGVDAFSYTYDLVHSNIDYKAKEFSEKYQAWRPPVL